MLYNSSKDVNMTQLSTVKNGVFHQVMQVDIYVHLFK